MTTPQLPPQIRALLCDPACYDHPVGQLELIQTHISWVLLTGSYAYKIRKPVSPGFLDFSTLALRHQDCEDELRLNRRLAADYYLDVVPICGDPDAPRINGSGEVFEYAVKMRQFSVDATLDKLAEKGLLTQLQIDALAARIAHFHMNECERAPCDSPWGEPVFIAQPIAENFRVLASRLEDVAMRERLSSLQGWCLAEWQRLAPSMSRRKREGWVRECHGDLHLANLAWVDEKLVIFDCLEFNPALRWIDVISEVAFCYMDLLHRGHDALAMRFLNAWLEVTGDYQGMVLLRYYAVYRALVRAKVAVLRADQGDEAASVEAVDCLQLADRLSRAVSSELWITHGLSGSGKTTLSQNFIEKCGMLRLRSDVERKRLFGLDALSRNGASAGLYTEAASRRTYEHLADLARELLLAGWGVLIDAAFLERWQRELFRDLALCTGVNFRILDIQAEPWLLRERVLRRAARGGDASEADLRVLQHQLETVQPLAADELSVTMPLSAATGWQLPTGCE